MSVAARLAGAAIALAGIVALIGDAELAWVHAAAAALVGAVLLSQSPITGALYGDVLARIPSPARRGGARALVLLTAPLAGIGVAVYAGAAMYLTLSSEPTEGRPVDWRTSIGTGFLGLAVVLAAVAVGVTAGGEGLLWATLLVGSGLALFWTAAGTRPVGDPDSLFEPARLRTQIGLVLVVAGAGLILNRTGAFGLGERTIVGAVAAAAVVALVFFPRWQRGARLLAAERELRAREQDRSEVAEVLHDSVLQTLALIQRRTDIPDEVAALARRQERELRAWLLHGERAGDTAGSLDEALRAVVAEVEDHHGVAIEAVIVGDAQLSPRLQAVIGAAREALVNAAKHGGAPISLFAKGQDGSVSVYVHDRGPGFDPEAIDVERRGVRESIVGRMERIGGSAHISTAPGAGCEVILILERA